jgi:hypothetical protein
LSSTALMRVCRAGALGLALSGALLATPAFADGGNSRGSLGGVDNPVGPGGDGALGGGGVVITGTGGTLSVDVNGGLSHFREIVGCGRCRLIKREYCRV